MAETTFNPGDIVYHKANNLRMVVLKESDEKEFVCKYVTPSGAFKQETFLTLELSPSTIKDVKADVNTRAIHKMDASSKD